MGLERRHTHQVMKSLEVMVRGGYFTVISVGSYRKCEAVWLFTVLRIKWSPRQSVHSYCVKSGLAGVHVWKQQCPLDYFRVHVKEIFEWTKMQAEMEAHKLKHIFKADLFIRLVRLRVKRAASSLEESVCTINLIHICQLGLWMVCSPSIVSLQIHWIY